jgi:hypothetical protein
MSSGSSFSPSLSARALQLTPAFKPGGQLELQSERVLPRGAVEIVYSGR